MLNRQNILSLCLILWGAMAFAQTDSTKYYFDSNNNLIKNPDSAAYYRVIDSRNDAGFRFTEYRKDGTWVKASAKGTIEAPMYDGYVNWYYKNGKPCEMHEYSYGRAVKTLRYHSNGILLQTIVYGSVPGMPYQRLMYEADSLGKANIINGNGTHTDTGVLIRGMLTEHYTMFGQYLNGAKEGIWEGVNDKNIHFSEKYIKGKFISGKSKTSEGKTYNYIYAFEYPIYSDNRFRFELWVKNHLKTPADTLHLNYRTSRWLQLNYLIDENGKPQHIKGFKPDGITQVDLVLERNPPKWAPATLRGVPISYQIMYNQGTVDFNKPMIFTGLKPFQTDIYLNNQYHPKPAN